MAWEPIIIIEPEHLGLHQTVIEQLLAQHKTIATAESCTGGSLAAWITTLPGASQVFECGVVTYANRIKTKLLGVKPQTLEQQGAVSYDTCAQMALGLEKLSGADCNVAITGIAGPDGGTPEKPVGTVYIGLACEGKVWVVKYQLSPAGQDREQVQALARINALHMVSAYLSGEETSSFAAYREE